MILKTTLSVFIATFSVLAYGQNWHKQFHSSKDFGVQNEGIHVLADGSAIISGQFTELYKVDVSGNLLWKRSFKDDEMIKIWEFLPFKGDTLLAWGSRTKIVYANFEYDYISQGVFLKIDTAGNILNRVVYDLQDLGYPDEVNLRAPANDYAGFTQLNDSTLIGSLALHASSSVLFCLNTDGSIRWHQKTTQQILEIIPDGTGNIIAGTNFNIYRINAVTGEYFWKIQRDLGPTAIIRSGTVSHQYVKGLFQVSDSAFVGGAAQSLFKISIEGDWIWEQEIASGYQMDMEIVDDHILTTSDEWLFEYDMDGIRTDSLEIDRQTRQIELHPDGILVAGTHTWNGYSDYGLNLYKLDWPVSSMPSPDSVMLGEAPSGPSNIKLSVGENEIQINWTDTSEDEDYFVLQKSIGDGYNYEDFAVLPANTTTYTDTEVEIAVNYYYRLKTTNKWGQEISGHRIGTLPPPLPESPSNLLVAETGNGFIRLSWQDNAQYESGFKLYRASFVNPTFAQIEDLPTDSETYLDESVSADIRYYYKLFAYNSTGKSDTLEVDTILLRPLEAITEIELEVSGYSEIQLSWESANANEEGYRIFRSTSASEGFELIAELSGNEHSFLDSELENETAYFYKIEVYRGEESETSATQSGTTHPLPPDMPDFIYAVNLTTDSVTLKWDPVERATYYVMEKRISLSEDEFELVEVTADTFLVDRQVTWGDVYNYRLKAVNAGGESEYYDELGVAIPYPMPDRPTAFTASASSDTSIVLQWEDNSDVERGFWIYRSLNSSSGFVIYKSLPENTTSFEDIGLESNTTYYYRLQAHNSARGTSSIYANATTLVSPPSSPSGVSFSNILETSVQIHWVDNSDNETQFTVSRSENSTTGFVTVDTLDPNTTLYTDMELDENTVYFYFISAINDGGIASSDTLQIETLQSFPKAPSSFTAISVASNQVSLMWEDQSNNENQFTLRRSIGNTTNFQDKAAIDENITEFQDKNLSENTTYYYVVGATNDRGSAFSDTISVTTSKSLPLAPTDLIGKFNKDSIYLSWTDNSFNETEYVLTRVVGTDTSTFSITANASVYIDLSAGRGMDNIYWLQAKNEAGLSDSVQITIFYPLLLDKPELNLSKTVFPNPFTNELQISSDVHDLDFIEIISITGQTRTFVLNKETTSIDVSTLAVGTYVIRLNMTNGKVYSLKAIKE